MEDLWLSSEEHKLLTENKKYFESQYNVQICVPEVASSGYFCKDVIFASISGQKEGIENVKNSLLKFLKQTENDDSVLICEEDSVLICEEDSSSRDIPLITLSDDDDEQSSEVPTNIQNEVKRKRKHKKKKLKILPGVKSLEIENGNICEVSSTTEDSDLIKSKPESFIPTDLLNAKCAQTKIQKEIDSSDSDDDVMLLEEPDTHIASSLNINNAMRTFDSKQSKSERFVPADDFIPLNAKCVQNKVQKEKKGSKQIQNGTKESSDSDNDIMLVEKPLPRDPKRLRPVVIDGSNVAREHGKVQNTFSCKGILLSVEFFLSRGHTQVTAFVPNFRRHHHFGAVPTTDHSILEELAKRQHVVFTPSRRVQGKRLTCYDDRFIVELASKTGGVILSNDNYKDLISVSDDFKKTIEERLLMFCFVGDLLMIPNDPLGREGPTLDDFLSFPDNE